MKFLIPLLALVFSMELSAQQAINYSQLDVKSVNKANQLPSLFVFKQANNNRPNIDNINDWFRQNLQANDEFKLVNVGTSRDIAGYSHIRYQQFYNNIPVEGSMLNTHYLNGEMQSMNGNYYTQLNVNTNPNMTESQALATAMSKYGNVEFSWLNSDEEALLKVIEENPFATYLPKGELVIISPEHSQIQEQFRLAYKFNIKVSEPMMREMVYIDAQNGDLLYAENLLHTTDVKGSGLSRYNGNVTFMCDSLKSDSFILRSSGRGKGIQTYNAKQATKLDTNSVFKSKTSSWNLVNSAKDEVALDIQWGMEQCYDFYKTGLGINSINDSGYKMVALVHVRKNYNNANWDGKYLNFGDGDGVSYKPFTSLDICGHEMTHGLTQKTAKLVYKNESGGLNESFSDIFGKCIEHYAAPDSFTWIVGKKIQFNGNYIRNMKEPTLKNNPKFYAGQYFIPAGTLYDNGGVHINSGVSNLWFHLLCEGGSGIRESDGKPFTVKSIGWEKATTIAYTTLANYLTPTSEFFDASELSQLVTRNLYGDTSDVANQVLMAWYGVGLASLPGSGLSDIVKQNTSVTITPNPATEQIKLKVISNQLLEASIIDITGKVMSRIEVYNGAIIPVSDLAKGVYMLRFNDGSSLKFVKI